ncbi:MAG: alpha-L-fucosidase [Prolixibacteraceae bacterium]|jgi:alpha-L-fucosidase|nr:alpha-L-fucosidase [Prolixibacteraceae bacterium]
MKRVVSILFLIALWFSGSGQTASNNKQKIEEWKDARFGMFIHWGPVALKGTEIGWSRGREIPVDEYDNLYKKFDAPNFDANNWATVAKAAGMKYIILTTKHHDGFCLWNTRQTDFNIMNSPLHRDVVKELAEACKKQGIAFGTYYSTTDWHHPDFPLTSPGGQVQRASYDLDAYTGYLKRQVAELLLNYGPLFVLWFDVPQRFDATRGQGVIDFAHTIQPDIIINNRTGAKGDYDTPEQRVGGFQNDRPWETCMTIANQWAWKPNDEVKSLEQCLQSLVRSAGSDGNLLFNVGPMPDGRIESLQVERLKEMGQWLQKYGYSIYGTRGGPFKPTDWGVSTRKGNTIYLHIQKWNGKNVQIPLPDLGMDIKNCKLASGGKMKVSKKEGMTILEISGESLQPINTIVEIETSGNVMNVKPLEIGSESLSYNKKVSASSNPDPNWQDIKSINNGDWVGHYWTPDVKDKMPWAEIDFGKPEKISKAIIYESGDAVKAFELQYLQNETWKVFYNGTTLGAKAELKFPKITAQKVRLVLKEFSKVPGIYEVVLL